MGDMGRPSHTPTVGTININISGIVGVRSPCISCILYARCVLKGCTWSLKLYVYMYRYIVIYISLSLSLVVDDCRLVSSVLGNPVGVASSRHPFHPCSFQTNAAEVVLPYTTMKSYSPRPCRFSGYKWKPLRSSTVNFGVME